MTHRVRSGFAVGLISCVMAMLVTALPSHAQNREPGELEIWQSIIRDSIASYPRSCPCPYSANRLGQRCGDRSAHSRGTPKSPMCYPQDIPDEQIARYRERMQ